MEDASLASSTQNKLSLKQESGTAAASASNAKPSLAALAAASKAAKPSLASFAKPKTTTQSSSSGLSELAAKSRASTQSSAVANDGPRDATMAPATPSPLAQQLPLPTQKLSKLQQRVLARNSGLDTRPVAQTPASPMVEEEESKADAIPESDLFPSAIQGEAPPVTAANASPFASTLVPTHLAQTKASSICDPARLGDGTAQAFSEPSPDDLVRQAKKPGLSNGNVPVRR